MSEHPIEGLMTTAMNSIQDMIDVNTIIGEPIETSNNIVIIPISKVSFGFAAGGSEFKGETIDEYKKVEKELMPVTHSSSIDKLLDYVPDLIERTNNMMNKMVNNKKEETEKVLKEMQKKNNKEKKAKEHKEQEENYEFEYDESIEDE